MKNLCLPVAIAILASGCSSLSPSEDPVALKVTDIEARLIRIERIVENQSLVELASELDRLRTETATLRGEIETLRFETENSDSRQRELYVDVDRRLLSLESAPRAASAAPTFAPPVADPAAALPVVTARPAGTDQQSYDAAMVLLEGRKYEEAGRAFTSFLDASPTSPLAANAQYWLAETLYVRGQYSDALTAFRGVIETYPQSGKLPDALLKVGYCQDELGDDAAARTSLQEVMRQFPGTTAERLAAQRLERLSR